MARLEAMLLVNEKSSYFFFEKTKFMDIIRQLRDYFDFHRKNFS
jgi:hypothetical protein